MESPIGLYQKEFNVLLILMRGLSSMDHMGANRKSVSIA